MVNVEQGILQKIHFFYELDIQVRDWQMAQDTP